MAQGADRKRRYIDALLAHRWLVLALIGAVTALAVWQSLKLKFDASIEIWFLDDDPGIVTYHEFLDRFGGDELILIGVFPASGDVFAPENIAGIDRLTRAAETAPHVRKTTSLTNMRVLFAGENDSIDISPLMDQLPETAEQADALRKRADRSELIEELLADNGTAAGIVVHLERDLDFDDKVEVVNAMREIIAGEEQNLHPAISGSAPLDEAFFRYSNRDFERVLPASILLVVLIGFIVFRRVSAALIPLFVVSLSNIWTFGLMGALGIDINVVSNALAAVVMAVGVADSIHVIADFYQEIDRGHERTEAIHNSFATLLSPCFFTTLTTVLGMLSLLVGDLKPVREFGWLAAIGVTVAFTLSMTLIPILLSVFRPPPAGFISSRGAGRMDRLLETVGRPTPARSRTILLATIAITAFCAWGVSQLHIGANVMNYFRKSDPVRAEIERVEQVIGGSASLELLVTAPDEGLKDPQILRDLDRLQSWAGNLDGVTDTNSILDALKEFLRLFDNRPPGERLPESRALAAQSYMLLESEDDFTDFVQDDYSVGRISVRVRISEAEALLKQLPEFKRKIAAEYDRPDLKVELTGFIRLMGEMENYLLASQIKSFATAFVVVTLMMFFVLRSVRLGLYAMIPNVLPIAAGLGFMGLAGIALDAGTVMVASIAIGLVVDDTIHFLVRLRRREDDGDEVSAAILGAVRDTGRPIIVTSFALAGGFSIVALGSFLPVVYFGLISAMVVILAVLADLFLMPALMLLVDKQH